MGFYEQHEHTSRDKADWWGTYVWKVSLFLKTKIFMWRLFMNIIPTEENLHNHHVPTDGICRFCRSNWDSTSHALFFCPRIRSVWKGSRFWVTLQRGLGARPNAKEVAEAIREKWGGEEYEVWCLLTWLIWRYVCRLKHNEDQHTHPPTEDESRVLLARIHNAKRINCANTGLGVKCGGKSWRPPEAGRYRVDVDVLFNPTSNMYGVGVIIRDCVGQFVCAMSRRTTPKSNVMIAEVMAIVDGIIFARAEEIMPIEVYSDSLLAARIMDNDAEGKDWLPQDIEEIMKLARESILLGVFHNYRSANQAAHCLAHYASHIDDKMIWRGVCPDWLKAVVSSDNSE